MAQARERRQRAILGAIVERYVATGEPVSSAWVSDNTDLGVCSATVRNEMAELERIGCLDHPHTSAGRVPTDRGYRLYVEWVMSRAETEDEPGLLADLSRERDAFVRRSGTTSPAKAEVEPALEATCRALARLTRYLSLAQPPNWGQERLTHLQLSRLDAHRVLAVLLTESGRVHHALLQFSRLPSAGQLRALAMVINRRLGGRALAEIAPVLLEQTVRDLWPQRSFTDKALRVITASLPATADSPLVVEGESHLLEAQEFQEATVARQVFGLIEERSYLSSLMAHHRPGLSVTIGEEAGHPAMRHCALMSATFEAPGGTTGCIGILGPKRMRYRPVMSALLIAARHLGAALAGR
jgi:heat-inducible transcriptional repressor